MKTKLVKCPACGAAIKAPVPVDRDTAITCRYCSSLIQIDVDEPGIIETSSLDLKPVITLVRKIKMHHTIIFLVVASLITLGIMLGIPADDSDKPVVDSKEFYIDEDSVQESPGTGEHDPTVNGKYSDLNQKVYCPRDSSSYGDFYDWGYWSGTSWCGQSVRPGYWVWVAPYWYIWKKKNR